MKPFSGKNDSTPIVNYFFAGALLVPVLTLLVYLHSINNGFVNWDDNEYIYDNNSIFFLHLDSLRWMLTSLYAHNWHPFTWLSHAVDYTIWGPNPWGHHLTNIVLHAGNALLVYLVIIQLLLRKAHHDKEAPADRAKQIKILIAALLTALLFGLHPVHVESVAWVSERKDLLCAFFSLLSISAYLSYVSSEVQRSKPAWYAASLLLFCCALLSKPMAVSLPAVLLLLDIYPLGKLQQRAGTTRSILLEKIPYVAISIGSGAITILAQSAGAIRSLDQLPLQARAMNAFRSLLLYLGKMAWPETLVPFYPLPKEFHWIDLDYLVPMTAVIALTFICVALARRGRYLVGSIWAYYLITLVPVIGIIQVGKQAAADRYTYLPSISIFLLAALSAAWIYGKITSSRYRTILFSLFLAGIAVIMIGLGQKTVKQTGIWHSSESLWKHVISVFPRRASIAYNNLGLDYSEHNQLDAAFSHYRQALMIDPGYVEAHNNLGILYHKQGKFNDALSCYTMALAIDPHYVEAQNNRGLTYYAMGKPDEAIALFKDAIKINPDFAESYYNLGILYYAQKMIDEAIASYRQALRIDPYSVEAHYNLGNAYFDRKRYDEAIAAYKNAIKIDPDHAMAYNNLGNAFANKKMSDEAIAAYKKALAINPHYLTAYNNLGTTFVELGEYGPAIDAFQKAAGISPDDPATNKNLSLAYYMNKDYKSAVFYCDKAQKLGYPMPSEFLELLKPYR
jgi:protein O-mannosyl-transferase